MPPTCRYPVDVCTGHGCWPPRNNASGSPDVFTNGLKNHRQSDDWNVHCCPPPCHSGKLAQGSPTVFTNGLQQGRIGDPISCGSTVATGSPDTFTGDGGTVTFATISVVYVHTDGLVYTYTEGAKVSNENDSPVAEQQRNEALTELKAVPEPEPQPLEEDDEEPEEPPEVKETDCGEFPVPTPDDFQLSSQFTLGDLSSQTVFGRQAGSKSGPVRAQVGLTYEDIVCNLKALAENSLEPLADKYGRSNMILTSGFRRGTGRSQHNRGMAIDIQWSGISNEEYYNRAQWIKDNIAYDQFILEFGSRRPWHHISFNRMAGSQRRQVLTYKAGRSPSYTPGLTLFA